MRENKSKKGVKFFVAGLALLLTIGVTATGIATNGFKGNKDEVSETSEEVKDNLETANVTEDGISIKNVKMLASSSNSLGRISFTYSVNPSVNTDHVLYKLSYSDGSTVEDGTVTVTIDEDKLLVTVECKKVFTKQIILTLYAQSDSNVKASITLDFKERLTVETSFTQEENKPLKFTTSVSTTGGSITVDKTVKNEQYYWNETFVNEYKQKLYKHFAENAYSSPENENYEELSINYVGLDQASLNKWFSGNYTAQSFVESIYLEGTYTWIYADDDGDPNEVTDRVYLTDLGVTEFNNVFGGTKTLIEYSCTVNGTYYHKNAGIKIDKLNISDITIKGSSGYVF